MSKGICLDVAREENIHGNGRDVFRALAKNGKVITTRWEQYIIVEVDRNSTEGYHVALGTIGYPPSRYHHAASQAALQSTLENCCAISPSFVWNPWIAHFHDRMIRSQYGR